MTNENELHGDEIDSNEIANEENAVLSGRFHGTTQEVLARYSHCNLCGANLHFTHVTDFTRNLTHETSRCPECGIKARRVIHKLQ